MKTTRKKLYVIYDILTINRECYSKIGLSLKDVSIESEIEYITHKYYHTFESMVMLDYDTYNKLLKEYENDLIGRLEDIANFYKQKEE